MALVVKRQEPARHPVSLQRLEGREPLARRDPVVERRVDQDCRRRILPPGEPRRRGRVPARQALPVGPRVRVAAILAVLDALVALEDLEGDGEDAVVPDCAAELPT